MQSASYLAQPILNDDDDDDDNDENDDDNNSKDETSPFFEQMQLLNSNFPAAGTRLLRLG